MCANAELHYNIFTYNKRAIFDCANGGQHISKTGQKKKPWHQQSRWATEISMPNSSNSC